jgi:hypothetical protein
MCHSEKAEAKTSTGAPEAEIEADMTADDIEVTDRMLRAGEIAAREIDRRVMDDETIAWDIFTRMALASPRRKLFFRPGLDGDNSSDTQSV